MIPRIYIWDYAETGEWIKVGHIENGIDGQYIVWYI